jgi:hypothetical protein
MQWGVKTVGGAKTVGRRGFHAALLGALLLPGCTATDPRPGPVRAMAPRPNPPMAPRRSVVEGPRQSAWLSRFWEELTPAQRRLVTARLRRNGRAGTEPASPPGESWDVMGLPDREVLVFGQRSPPVGTPPAAALERQAAAEAVPARTE